MLAAPEATPLESVALNVRPSDLDPLDHVNNAVYLDWLEEALETAGWLEQASALPRTCRLEYLASAARGDAVRVELHGRPESWQAVIRREDGLELVRAMGATPTPLA